MVTIFASCLGAAVAAWLWRASVHIVAWPEAGPHRVAVFAPQYLFIVLIGAALGAAALLWMAGGRTPSGRARLSQVLAPLVLLWAWAIPYLPWLPDRYPLLLILAGPVRWLILGAAIAGVGVRAGWLNRIGSSLAPHLPGASAAFVVSLILFGVMGWRSYSAIGITGDEPHYLVIAHSLMADGDLRIENNHASRDYRLFFGGVLRPDYLRRGRDGQIYSIHAPGIPALVLPAYALAGAPGALLMIAVLAALAAAAIFALADRIGGLTVGWLTWSSVCLTVPMLPHAWAIYPEAGALAIVAWAALWLASPAGASPATWAMRGAVLALLPWLHTKLVVFLAAFALWFFLKLRGRLASAVALAAPILISSAAWLAFFYAVYGTVDPQAPYGGSVNELQVANIPRSLFGLLTDQKFGLLTYAPVYLFAGAGAWCMWRDRNYRPIAVAFAATAVAFAASSGRLYMWWGGSSAPARFLVPVLPLLAAMLAFAFARLRRPAAIGALVASLAVSVAIAVRALIDMDERLLFSDPRGVSRLAETLQGSAPLTAALPSFTQENWTSAARQVAPWAVAAVIAAVAGRTIRARSALTSLSIQALIFILISSMLAGPVAAEARQSSAARGAAGLMEAFDPGLGRAFDFKRLAKLSPAEWLNAARIDVALDPPVSDPQGRLSPPFSLPPGRYWFRVWFRHGGVIAGDLELMVRRGQALARQRGPLPAPLQVDLPLGLPAAWLQLTDRTSAQAAVRMEIAPDSLAPRSARPPFDAVAAEPVGGWPGAYIVYADERTYPEGGVFWTRGTARGQVLVAPAGAGTLALTLHAGAAASVRVTVGEDERVEALAAGETREITRPIPPGVGWFPLSVESSASFRPSEVDPASSDGRSLGCQVRVGLR